MLSRVNVLLLAAAASNTERTAIVPILFNTLRRVNALLLISY